MGDIDFLAGFIAGEAHLGVTKNYQWKPYVHPRFSIDLHERDSDVLYKIAELIQAEDRIEHRKDRPHVSLRVKKSGQIERLRDMLDRCDSDLWKSSDKYENFQIWSEIVDIHCSTDSTTTDEERKRIAELAKELNKDAGHNNVDWDEFIERLEAYDG